MTMAVVAEVLSEFEWPAPYTLDDWQPDGIAVVFLTCTLVIVESFESEMELEFSDEDTGVEYSLSLTHALMALRAAPDSASLPPTPKLIAHSHFTASLDRVKNGIRNLCTLVLTYLSSYLLGDKSWIQKYKDYVLAKRSTI